MASNDGKHLPKIDNAIEASFEFSMVRRRSVDEVRWHVHVCVSVHCAVSLSVLKY